VLTLFASPLPCWAHNVFLLCYIRRAHRSSRVPKILIPEESPHVVGHVFGKDTIYNISKLLIIF
jgi:hypothetical protein